ncbi:PTS system, mannose-specific IID component [Sporolactobacillus inulinus]|uniref:PTS system, mannose-specific IID component n=1 Tax=Sporolactobacillus inulinus TaxID=2078 RepID=A0A4Y1ZD40_9BACL|nr:PTS system, mannose-specific IID component [Sporolactobacillus inulinus]
MEKNDVVTKKDIRKASIRYMFMACNTFNYENQQAPAVVYGLSKVLRKIHKKDEDYKASLNNHFNYFNTTTWMANLLLGASIAMEEKDGIKVKKCRSSIQNGDDGTISWCW